MQDFHTPSYSDTDLTGGGFGLSYIAARYYGSPVRPESLSADATVLNNSIVTVIGPTPPGTGVM